MSALNSPVTATRLADLLKLYKGTIDRWRRTGILPTVGLAWDGSFLFARETIDSILSQAHGVPAPTALDLLTSRITLLTTDEAAARLACDPGQIRYQITRGNIGAIHLPGHFWRVVEQSLLAPTSGRPKCYTFDQTMQILGGRRQGIRNLIRQDLLTIYALPENRRQRFLTDASVVPVVASRLPDWISPRDWIDEVLSDPRPLYRVPEVMARLECSKRAVYAMTHQQRSLWYIRQANGTRLILPATVDGLIQRKELLS
jgi:hypothetical protein